MDNLFAFMCFGALILLAVFAFISMMGWGRRGASSTPFGGPGNEAPRYDDPNVGSGGSFGGSFGGNAGGAPIGSNRGVTLGGESPRHDDSNVRSGGSFGG